MYPSPLLNFFTQLDNLETSIYDYVYLGSDDKQNNYQISYTETKNLNINRFKINYDMMSTMKLNIVDIINKETFKFIGNYNLGLHDDVYLWKKTSGNYPSTLRIIPYNPEYGNDIDNIARPENVNKIIKVLLSDLVISKKTMNILLPIINYDIKKEELQKIEMIKNYTSQISFSYDNYSIEFTEHFKKSNFLINFLKDNELTLPICKTIFKQLIKSLDIITSVYSGFRHNNLTPSTIEVYYKKNKNDDTIIPELKISNFYLSEIKNIVTNNILNKLNIPYIDNIYSDLFYFIYNFIKLYDNKIDNYTKQFINDIYDPSMADNNGYLDLEKWKSIKDYDKNKYNLANILKHKYFSQNETTIKQLDKPVDSNLTIESYSNINLINFDKKQSIKSKKQSKEYNMNMKNKKKENTSIRGIAQQAQNNALSSSSVTLASNEQGGVNLSSSTVISNSYVKNKPSSHRVLKGVRYLKNVDLDVENEGFKKSHKKKSNDDTISTSDLVDDSSHDIRGKGKQNMDQYNNQHLQMQGMNQSIGTNAGNSYKSSGKKMNSFFGANTTNAGDVGMQPHNMYPMPPFNSLNQTMGMNPSMGMNPAMGMNPSMGMNPAMGMNPISQFNYLPNVPGKQYSGLDFDPQLSQLSRITPPNPNMQNVPNTQNMSDLYNNALQQSSFTNNGNPQYPLMNAPPQQIQLGGNDPYGNDKFFFR
jgi:hypothetical protein